MSLKKYFWLTSIVILIAITALLLFGTYTMFILAYITSFLVLLARTSQPRGQKLVKFWLIIAFGFFLAFQIVVATQLLLIPGIEGGRVPIDMAHRTYWPRRIICTFIILVPLVISRYIIVGKYAQLYLPSVKETGTIGFAELKGVVAQIKLLAEKADTTRESLSPGNLMKIISDFPRHDSFNYINEGTLTENYFAKVEEALTDEHLYIIVSQTGSAASSFISLFTNKDYNHVSISFDRELETAVSYNGGNNIYPPGMNPEMLADFTRNSGASILVYSLPCSAEKKAKVLQRIREINESGSAYNMLGLVTKHSYRPNIMFCSQFVYKLLETEELIYFERVGRSVVPTDFVELDYRRALAFEYEIGLTEQKTAGFAG